MNLYFIMLVVCLIGPVYSNSKIRRFVRKADGHIMIRCPKDSFIVTKDAEICTGSGVCLMDFKKLVYFCLKKQFQKSNCIELTRDTVVNQDGCYFRKEHNKIKLNFPKDSDKVFHILVLHKSIELVNSEQEKQNCSAFCLHACGRRVCDVTVDVNSLILVKISNEKEEGFEEFFMEEKETDTKYSTTIAPTKSPSSANEAGVERFVRKADGHILITCPKDSYIVTKDPEICTGSGVCLRDFDKLIYFCIKKQFQKSNCIDLTRHTVVNQDGCYFSKEHNKIELNFPKGSNKIFHILVLHKSIVILDSEQKIKNCSAFCQHTCSQRVCDVTVDVNSLILVKISDESEEGFEEFFMEEKETDTKDSTRIAPTESPSSANKAGAQKFSRIANGHTMITCPKDSYIATEDPEICTGSGVCSRDFNNLRYFCLKRQFQKSNCIELTQDTMIDQDGCYYGNDQNKIEPLFPKDSKKFFHIFGLHKSIEVLNSEENFKWSAFYQYVCCNYCNYKCNVKLDGNSWILVKISSKKYEDFGDFFMENNPIPTTESKQKYTTTIAPTESPSSVNKAGVERFFGRVNGQTLITCPQDSYIVTKDPEICTGSRVCSRDFNNIGYACLKKQFQKSNCIELTRDTVVNQDGCYYGKEPNKFQLHFQKDSEKFFHIFGLHKSVEVWDSENSGNWSSFYRYICCHQCNFKCNVKLDGNSWILVKISSEKEEDFGEFFMEKNPIPTTENTNYPTTIASTESPISVNEDGVERFFRKANDHTTITCPQDSYIVTKDPEICTGSRVCSRDFKYNLLYACLKKQFQKSNCIELTRDTVVNQDGCYYGKEPNKFQLHFQKDSEKFFHIFGLHKSVEVWESENNGNWSAFYQYVCCHQCNFKCNLKLDGNSWILVKISSKKKEDYGDFFMEYNPVPTTESKQKYPVSVRLVGTNKTSSGRVEVLYRGSWGTICDDNWGQKDAAVICRMLGFSGGEALTSATYGQGSGDILMDEVKCLGTESSIDQCDFPGWGEHDCEHKEDAGVKCIDAPVSVRLVGTNKSSSGRVEILYRGSWGTICDDNWDQKDAAVICRMLGFSGGEALTSATYGQGSGDILMDEVKCLGTESAIDQCDFPGWGQHDCEHKEDAGVKCIDAPVSLRLVGTNKSSSGRVEMLYRGSWGTICDDNWDQKDANVICRMLGFSGGEALTSATYGQGSGDILMDEVKCLGTESSIDQCDFPGWGKHDCEHKEDAGVKCIDAPASVRLVGTNKSSSGRVEILYRGSWGTICDDNWDQKDANVICRMLGFSDGEALPSATYGQGSGDILMDEVKCLGTESSIDQCDFPGWGEHDCEHKEDAGVKCIDAPLSVRLVGTNKSSSGRVEILYRGSWGTICDDNWDQKDANVICRMLGFSGGQALPTATYGQGSGDILMDEVKCLGTESSIDQCDFPGWGEHDCEHKEDAGVKCIDDIKDSTTIATTESPTTAVNKERIRLLEADYINGGRVEVFHEGVWGTICDDDWDDSDAAVVCSMLGYPYGKALVASRFGRGSGAILLDNVACTGNEASLFQCGHNGWGEHNCNHTEDASVICFTDREPTVNTGNIPTPEHVTYPTQIEGSVRLRNGSESKGRVEVFHQGSWGTICDDYWDERDAFVVCRMLGYTRGLAMRASHFGDGNGEILLDDVHCQGNESSISECDRSDWKDHDCSHTEDVGVSCW